MTRSDLRRAAVRALTLAVALGAAAAPARAQNLTLHGCGDFGGSSWVVVPANWGALNSTGAVVPF